MPQKSPIYDLNSVRAAARKERIILWRRADLDREGLGYSVEDVANCIQCLQVQDFHKSYEYDDDPNQCFDCYKVAYLHPGQQDEDELYIKLKLTPKGLVLIVSFHGEGRVY